MADEFATRVIAQATAIRDRLLVHPKLGRVVNTIWPIPRPFIGSGPIRLVIIGQDPTVQRAESLSKIKTVLNLDRRGSLRIYLTELCTDLELDLDQHVYATNACKCFFTASPTTIAKLDGIDVLAESAPLWLPLLAEELAHFPDARVISLGEPVLQMLVKPEHQRPMREYWGYTRRWRDDKFLPMHAIEAEESAVGRRIFPIVHQPTRRGKRAAFYRERRRVYLTFMREQTAL